MSPRPAIAIIRQKLRTAICQLVKRIEVFPNGLKGRIFSMNRLQFEYVDLRQTELGCEPGEYDGYLKETTGREHRLVGICFNAGSFRELYYDGTRLSVYIEGENTKGIWQELRKLIHNNHQ